MLFRVRFSFEARRWRNEAVGQLVRLITRSSQVQILAPQPISIKCSLEHNKLTSFDIWRIKMGLELMTFCFREKDAAPYPRAVAEAIFNRGSIDPSTPLITVDYADGSGEVYGAEKDEINGVTIVHFRGRTIIERVFELAVETNSMLSWTSDVPANIGVTSQETLDHLPEDVKQNKIVIVRNVDEFIRAFSER
jgi:hypothetical protein